MCRGSQKGRILPPDALPCVDSAFVQHNLSASGHGPRHLVLRFARTDFVLLGAAFFAADFVSLLVLVLVLVLDPFLFVPMLAF